MKILSDFNLSVDPDEVKQHLENAEASIPTGGNKELLKQIFGLIDLTTQVNEAVDRVNTQRRQASTRCFVFARAPCIRFQEQAIGKRHRRFAMQYGAEVAGSNHLAKFCDLRMKPPVVADA